MSQELPQNNNEQEFDVIYIFSVIEKVLKKIGDFISKTFKHLLFFISKILIFLLLLINLARRNFLVIVLSFFVGFGVFYYLNKPKTVVYSSNMLLKQNFQTGKVLYLNISTFNSLASAGDSIALSKELNIPINVASKIKGFTIFHSANKNLLMEEYFDFKKLTDSTTKISYNEFISDKNLEDFPLQSIHVNSSSPIIYDGLSNALITSILKNKYLENLKNSDIEIITRKKNLLTQLVSDSDSLQSNYFDLLKDYYGLKNDSNDRSKNATINLNLDGKKDKITTKEYDLYMDSKSLKLEINEIEDELKLKKEIFIIQKEFATPFVVKNDYVNKVISSTLIFVLIILLILLVKEFGIIKLLDKYGTFDKLTTKRIEK